jgi:tRNA pseudouridine-54 N-methylase
MVRRIEKAGGADGTPPAGFIFHRDDSLKARLEQFFKEGPVLMLNEGGEPLWDVLVHAKKEGASSGGEGVPKTTTLILGNQIGYSESDEKLLVESDKSVRQVSVGSLSLLTSQCITITHHYLDTLAE